jgi:uroporphyrinogen-III synthase
MIQQDQILQGKRILVTRAKKQAGAFSDKIRQMGGIPIELPLILIQPTEDESSVLKVLRNHYSWIVFTSTNGVDCFFQIYDRYFINRSDKLSKMKIAAVGKKTYAELVKRGLTVELIPEQFTAQALIDTLQSQLIPGDHVLLARGNLAANDLPEQLQALGAIVTDTIVYRTVLNQQRKEELYSLIRHRKIDIITFTSSSTAISFAKLLDGTDWIKYIGQITVACIGPVTANTVKQLNMKVDIIPEEYSIDGLLESIEHYIEGT